MAAVVLTNANVYLDSYDATTDANKVNMDWKFTALDATTFGSSGYKSNVAGLGETTFQLDGFWQANNTAANAINGQMFAQLGTTGKVVTVSDTGADQEPAYTAQNLRTEASSMDQVGAIKSFTIMGVGSSGTGPIAGYLLLPKSVKTTTGTGTVNSTLGAVSATQKLYAAMHIFAASGTLPTLDVTVKSAALVGFGSPTTRLTFAQQTTTGSVFATPVTVASTDAFWRVDYTIAGTNPSFTFAVNVGIR